MAKGIRVDALARELKVPAKAVLMECRQRGRSEVVHHLSELPHGLANEVRSWFTVPTQVASARGNDDGQDKLQGVASGKHVSASLPVKARTQQVGDLPAAAGVLPPPTSKSPPSPSPNGQIGQANRALKERFVLLPPPPREGGMSSVYQAFDMQTSAKVAVKLFASSVVAVDFLNEAYRRECEALQSLKHPGIVGLIDFGVDELTGRRYLVLEWVEDSLSRLIASGKHEGPTADWDHFAELVGIPILEALSLAHNRSIAHRDVKPGNILLTPEGHGKLADFGISKLKYWLQAGVTLSEFYSPLYSPPGPNDSAYDYSRDVFGFGMIVLACLSRVPPTDHADITKSLDGLDVPADIRKIIERAVSLDPEERPRTAGVLLSEITATHGRQQLLAARKPCYVSVTQKAAASIQAELGIHERPDIDKFVLDDLNDDPAIRPYRPTLPPAGTADLGVQFAILGGQFRYHAVVDRDGKDRLVLLNAILGNSVAHERQKDEALRPSLVFRLGRPASGVDGRLILDDLEHEAEAFVAELKVRELQAREERLMRAWEGILRAKSRLEQERRKPLRYSRARVEGQRAVFQLDIQPDEDLVGEDRRVELPPGRFLEGQVESVDGSKLTLYIVRGNPQDIPEEGSLVVDTMADQESLRRQQAALDAVAYDQALRPDLRKLLVNPSFALLADTNEEVKPFQAELDEEKQKVVAKALRSVDLLAVEGPPGTGKTTLITEIVLQTLARRSDARILLTSQTRVALDNAVQRIVEIDPNLRIVRVGRASDGRTSEQVQNLLLLPQLDAWRQEAIRDGKEFIAAWAARHGVPRVEIEVAILIQELAAKLRAVDAKRVRVKEELARLESLQKMKLTGTSDPADAVLDVDGELSYAKSEVEGISEDIASLDRDIGRLRQNLNGHPDYGELSEASVTELDEWVTMLLPDTDESRIFHRMLRLHGEWIGRFGHDRTFNAALIERSQVVAGTCIGMMAVRGTDEIEYDLCIIDEASKATPTEALVPMSRSMRWILVGDEHQLPPFRDQLVHDADLREEFGLTREEVTETLFGRLLKMLPRDCHESLTLQHRMVRPIGDLISHCFYGGRLKSTDKALDSDLAAVLARPVTWLTTSGRNSKREERSQASYTNWSEAEVIRALLRMMDFRAKHRNKRYSVAVISGYAAQRRTISDLITPELQAWANLSIECNTVDAIQGREADVVIYSVTRSNESESIGFLRARERLNVALSRGKVRLVIVGDHQFVRRIAGDNPLRTVLEYIESHPMDCCVKEAPL